MKTILPLPKHTFYGSAKLDNLSDRRRLVQVIRARLVVLTGAQDPVRRVVRVTALSNSDIPGQQVDRLLKLLTLVCTPSARSLAVFTLAISAAAALTLVNLN